MLNNERLRSLLGDLARGRRAAAGDATAPAPAPGAEVEPGTGAAPAGGPGTRDRGTNGERGWPRSRRTRGEGVGVEAFLPGGEWRDERGAVFVHERLRSEIEKRGSDWGRLGEPPEEEEDLRALAAAGLSRALFLDLETGGLASSPVFLAGTMHWNGEDFVVRQYFARHYGEEAALLRAVAEAARGFEYLVTFNGKSYDAPFLTGRGVVHGVRLALPSRHVDLLHPSRRLWKDRLPDCRLTTLELHVCRRRRWGDVPGEEVPGLYHDYVRNGDPYRLIPVFHHNMLDVITMAEILGALCGARSAAVRAHDPTIGDWR